MKIINGLVCFFIFIPLLSFSQNKTSPTINLDSIEVDFQKNAFKLYRDSLDTSLSKLDRSKKRRIATFKIIRNDTLEVEGKVTFSRYFFNIKNIEYTSSTVNKKASELLIQNILKTIYSAYRNAYYKYMGKHFGCEYSGGKIWKFLVTEETKKHFKKSFDNMDYYSFGVELNKGRISFIKTNLKLKSLKGEERIIEEQYINFGFNEEDGIYLKDSEVNTFNKSKNYRLRVFLDFNK